MMSRSVRLSLVGIAVVLLFAASAWAQIVDVSGIVQRVDVAARTIYLTDGRAVVLKPDAHLMINGREIALGDVQPGATLVTTATPATAFRRLPWRHRWRRRPPPRCRPTPRRSTRPESSRKSTRAPEP
ncbi:MAG: hypothetical protein DMD81_21250 [Candidatus Rokuibacteriota bacterium]|nr:MAG: hypothetical protein DMD81_21250 [Candidatus Rokubacteria bacterium]